MNEKLSINDFKGIVRRRRSVFIVFFLAIMLLGIIIAFILPPIYLSKSTILIENQLIPQEYVQTTITGFVEERLQVITQQIMSRIKLMNIIKEYGLYTEMQEHYATEEIIDKMRRDIILSTISADVIDHRTGRPTSATIAFSLSYQGKDPEKVQKVANVLASLYLEENIRSRGQRASSLTSFLQAEGNRLKSQIDFIQTKISVFKKAHIGELPEYTAVNLQAITRLERDLDQINSQIYVLKERKIYLEGQIANIDPLNPIFGTDGKLMLNPSERLKLLHLQLITLKSKFSEKHPDVRRVLNEINELESEVGGSNDSIEKIKRLEGLSSLLAVMKNKLGPKHPDLIKLNNELLLLNEEVIKMKTDQVTKDFTEQNPDNPAYINLKIQIESSEMELVKFYEEKKRIKDEIAKYQKKIESTPLVEKAYNNMMLDYANARSKYNEIKSKLMAADIAQGMEESKRGERFTIIEPAQYPEKPYKPNRIAIIIISFILSFGMALGIAAIFENMDTTIKTTDQLSSIVGYPVLSTIHHVRTDKDRQKQRKKKIIISFATISIIILTLIIVNFFLIPLDILWHKIQTRMLIRI